MKKLHVNKRTILSLAKKACKYLKLPLPKFKFEYVYNYSERYDYFKYRINTRTIFYALIIEELIINPRKKVLDTLTYKEMLIFGLFHEIGHYWHNLKHIRHFNNCLSKYEYKLEDDEEYNKQRIEKIADSIAWILYKKVYKGKC